MKSWFHIHVHVLANHCHQATLSYYSFQNHFELVFQTDRADRDTYNHNPGYNVDSTCFITLHAYITECFQQTESVDIEIQTRLFHVFGAIISGSKVSVLFSWYTVYTFPRNHCLCKWWWVTPFVHKLSYARPHQ